MGGWGATVRVGYRPPELGGPGRAGSHAGRLLCRQVFSKVRITIKLRLGQDLRRNFFAKGLQNTMSET